MMIYFLEFFKVEPKVVTDCPPSDFIRFIQKLVSEKSNEAYRIRIVKTGLVFMLRITNLKLGGCNHFFG